MRTFPSLFALATLAPSRDAFSRLLEDILRMDMGAITCIIPLGSSVHAPGKLSPGSDLDLLLVSDAFPLEFTQELQRVAGAHRVAVDLTCATTQEIASGTSSIRGGYAAHIAATAKRFGTLYGELPPLKPCLQYDVRDEAVTYIAKKLRKTRLLMSRVTLDAPYSSEDYLELAAEILTTWRHVKTRVTACCLSGCLASQGIEKLLQENRARHTRAQTKVRWGKSSHKATEENWQQELQLLLEHAQVFHFYLELQLQRLTAQTP